MTTPDTRRRRARGLAAALLAVTTGIAGGTACGVLDVTNPNNVLDSSLEQPTSATNQTVGVIAAAVRGLSSVWGPYHTATDEFFFTGSQDFFGQLDRGNPSDPANQFVGDAFQRLAQARWLGDNAIRNLRRFDSAGTLANRADLANAYLYTALVYVTAADMYDDFPVASDRERAAQTVGERNMASLYDTAVVYLDRGLTIATAVNAAELRRQALALRARTRYQKRVWQLLKPARQFPIANPLVADDAAVADAQAALAAIGAADWSWSVTPTLQGTGSPNVGGDLNQRREFRIGCAYAAPVCEPVGAIRRNTILTEGGLPVIVLNDPVTRQPDAVLRANVQRAVGASPAQLLPMTVVSAREMHLIVAEAALARGQTGEFVAAINRARALSGQGAWDGTGVQPLELLRHTRRVQLFLQGRRLADMYRFGDRDPEWQPTSTAARTPGCFFAVPEVERLAAAAQGISIPAPTCR